MGFTSPRKLERNIFSGGDGGIWFFSQNIYPCMLLKVLEDSSVQVVSSVEDMDQAPVILDISSLYTGGTF